jgi:hypothetical protein
MNKLSSVYHGGAGVRTLKEGTGTQLSDHQQKPSIAVGVFLVPASKSSKLAEDVGFRAK